MRRSFTANIDKLLSWCGANKPPPRVVIEVTEKYARKTLRIKRKAPLEYKGIALHCIGSKRWRHENTT